MDKKIASIKKSSKNFTFEYRPEPELAVPGTHDTVLEILKSFPSGKLLDVGGGTGHFARVVQEMYGMKVYVTELKRNYVIEAIPHIAEVDLNSDLLPYEDNFFDIVTCIEVTEHLKNPWFAITEISRVLKKGGVLILSTPNIHNVCSKWHFLFNNYIHGFGSEIHRNPLEHLHPFSLVELKRLLYENDFHIENILYSGPLFPLLSWSSYVRNVRSRNRALWRNVLGYIKLNFKHCLSLIISFLLYKSWSLNNQTFGQICVLVATKNNAK